MITIKSKDGKETFRVTKGAYAGVFAKQGYTVAHPVVAGEEAHGGGNAPELSGDELFAAELLEKPIAQWSKEEVKRFAAIKGINVAGAKTVSEVKELIKAALA